MNMVNLTKDPISLAIHNHLARWDDEIQVSQVIQPSGIVATVETMFDKPVLLEVFSPVGTFINTAKAKNMEVILPPREEGVIYIVTPDVARAVPDRDDIYFADPDVVALGGDMVACRGLLQYHHEIDESN